MLKLDLDLKREYLEAVERVPHLVELETPMNKFLRTEDNNPWSAAHRLAHYWKHRKGFMRADRWLRPMNQTGKGCLGQEEIALLRRGIYNYTCTEETGPVVVVNGASSQGVSEDVMGRVFLYLWTVLDDVAIQTTGVTVVYAVTSADTESYIVPRFGECMAKGLPVKFRRFVVVQNREPHNQSLVQFFAERRQLQVNFNYQRECELICSDESQQDLLRRVEAAGIPSKALPLSCGGHFDDMVPSEWMRQRLTLEEVMNSCSPAQLLRLKQGKPVHRRARRKRKVPCKQQDDYACDIRSKIFKTSWM